LTNGVDPRCNAIPLVSYQKRRKSAYRHVEAEECAQNGENSPELFFESWIYFQDGSPVYPDVGS
jgi:hypothetical protein